MKIFGFVAFGFTTTVIFVICLKMQTLVQFMAILISYSGFTPHAPMFLA